MAALEYEKTNERFTGMKVIFKKFVFILRDVFSLMFKSKDGF
jgi:hypothetical protein